MRIGRTLLAGLGWAGVLGGVALCVLIFLSVYLALDDDPSGVSDHPDHVVKLSQVPLARVPAVPLARPRRALAETRRRAAGAAAARERAAARRRAAAGGRRITIGVVAPGPGGGIGTPPAGGDSSPAPAPLTPSGAGGGGGGEPPQSSPGDTPRSVTRVMGTEVGEVSPPVGKLIVEGGDTAAGALDSSGPPSLPVP
jgi:hypothetical protein